MPSRDPHSLSDRFSNFYEELSTAAAELNAASDELGKPIVVLDHVLKDLNLGIPTWVKFAGDQNESGDYWQNCVGYDKAGGKWGISVSRESGYVGDPDGANFESWPFNESPRALRIEAIEKLPDLLEQLIKNTRATTEKVRAKAKHAKELADVMKTLAAKRK